MVDDEIPVRLRDGKILNVQISSGLSPSTIVVPRSPTMRSSKEFSTEASAPTRRAEAFHSASRIELSTSQFKATCTCRKAEASCINSQRSRKEISGRREAAE